MMCLVDDFTLAMDLWPHPCHFASVDVGKDTALEPRRVCILV